VVGRPAQATPCGSDGHQVDHRQRRGPWDVEDRYEAFWNRLNDSWEWDFPKGKEKVKVMRVDVVGLDQLTV